MVVHRKPLFLRWAVINAITGLVMLGSYLAYWHKLDELGGGSRVAFAIAAVFAIMSVYCGRLMFRTDTVFETYGKPGDIASGDRKLVRIKHDAEHVWFSVSLLQILGLLGTVLGFLIAIVGGFGNLTSSDPEAIKNVIQTVGDGAATALIATLVGIATSVVLGLEYHLLSDSIARHEAGVRGVR